MLGVLACNLKITAALEIGTLDKQECLMLRGSLGFADSFLHGRVGKLVLKKLIDHAYGKSSLMDGELKTALLAMRTRLQQAGPKLASAKSFFNGSFTQMPATSRQMAQVVWVLCW